jgi:hypothetical protein
MLRRTARAHLVFQPCGGVGAWSMSVFESMPAFCPDLSAFDRDCAQFPAPADVYAAA